MTSIRIPVTNVYAKGGYTARLYVGAQHHPVNLILDTGSSALVVHDDSYQPGQDSHLTGTTLVQDVQYGKGGWYGPVVQTSIRAGLPGHHVALDGVSIALTSQTQVASFLNADGILGLAYTPLDNAYDLTEFLTTENVNPRETYPYVMQHAEQGVSHYSHFLRKYPKTRLAPYFTQLEESGAVANQFALLTHRSSIYHTKTHQPVEKLLAHHLNHGLFVLGDPLLHRDLYTQPVKTLAVLHDKYYNVNVLSIRVGDGEPITGPVLDDKHVESYCTNGIVDSGASAIVLPQAIFEEVKRQLIAYNADFAPLLAHYEAFTGEEVGIDAASLDLSQWPAIHITCQGSSDEVITLTLTPDTYWQVHAPAPGKATFKFCHLPGWPNQIILGLPLLNNYYTIFDRSAGDTGEIHFATKVDIPGHMIQAVHHALQPASKGKTNT